MTVFAWLSESEAHGWVATHGSRLKRYRVSEGQGGRFFTDRDRFL